ncbi:Cof-type HAD-IIB family hydrolase [Streptomyces marincola]|uniref:Cof-type HAD-IIB family hydrolase n=1 Tax=Streptomyces marincola TaxID=2878388 RepID=UPI0021002C92|nr:Cof-type HAD-IIB family hydrolase [Streptomyces marincola]
MPTLPRLIATDLDGTLLRNDATVSPRTVAALAAAERAGIHVLFVTGRPARWMGVVSAHVHGHGLAICGNGAAVADLHRGGELVETRPIQPENALAVVHALRRVAPGVSFAVERAGGIHHEPAYPPLSMDVASEVAPVEKLLSPARDRAAHPVLKLLAHHGDLDPDVFLRLGREAAAEHGEFTRSSRSALLEISAPGVSKASTLAQRCRRFGIRPDEVMAFGDMPNDLEMLGWVGTGYAMANAHPAVLAAAHRRTASNEEDGVALVIEELLSGAAR